MYFIYHIFHRLPRSKGFPWYINECDATQNVFATYNRYKELKNTYAKYDPTRYVTSMLVLASANRDFVRQL